MPGDIFDPFDPAVTLEVAAAAIKRPGHIGNLASHQRLLVRDAGAYRHIGFALGDIEEVVAHDEFDPQAGMTAVKGLKQRRLHQSVADELRAGHPNRAGRRFVGGNQIALERADRFFDLFGPGPQLGAELGQPVAGRMPDHDVAPDALFQFGQPPVNGRLAEIERLRGCDRAAMAGHRQEMPKIVPVKHELFTLDFARRNLAAAAYEKIRLSVPH